MKKSLCAGIFAIATMSASGSAFSGTVVVNGDEWALSNSGFSLGDATQFVSNLVAEFGNTIHAYSTNFGYTGSSLSSAMATAGASYTYGTAGFDFSLSNLLNYDAIFLGGTYLTSTQLGFLGDYVDGGGNVYISAGTGAGGSAAEAGAWNDFLAALGIELGTVYTGFTGSVTTTGDSLFDGVGSLYIGNPNAVVAGAICCQEQNVFAVWRSDDDGGSGVSPVPLPASLPMLGVGLLGFGFLQRRRRPR